MTFQISNDVIKTPYFGILYGRPGTGKTWLCSHAEKPFYLAVEKGCEHVPNVGRFTDGNGLNIPKDIDTFFNMLKFLVKEPNSYKTVVIDSGKFIDHLIVMDVIAKNPTTTIHKEEVIVNSISDYTFGSGYDKALSYWERIGKGIDALNKKGINVILITHAIDRTVSNSSGDDYKKSQIDLLQFGGYSVPNLLYAKCDWCYYIASEAKTIKRKNAFGTQKTIADKSNKPEIIVYTRSTNAFDAKVRTTDINNIPDEYMIDIENNETSKQIFCDLEK